MMHFSGTELKEKLEASQNKVYISCVGEEGFPNVTVRKVDIHEDLTMEYMDNGNSRTVQLMKNSPQVIVNVLDPADPFHGYKIKGKAEFQDVGPVNEKNELPTKVTITLKEGFPY